MQYTDIARSIVHHYQATRGTGNTTAALQTAPTGTVVLIGAPSHARTLKARYPGCDFITPEQLHKLNGANLPLIVDHNFLVQLISKTLEEQQLQREADGNNTFSVVIDILSRNKSIRGTLELLKQTLQDRIRRQTHAKKIDHRFTNSSRANTAGHLFG